jgi:hypothetical protein
MTWADQIAGAAKDDVSLEWLDDDERQVEGHAAAPYDDFVERHLSGTALDDEPGALEEEHLEWRPPAPDPTEDTQLGRVFDAGAQRFEHLVAACQAELEDAVSAHVSAIGQTIAEGTSELNRAADTRVAELEREVDTRLAELEDEAVNDRFAELASRMAVLGRLTIAALIMSIVALGVALAALAATS